MKLEWKIEKRKIADLKDWPRNPRKLTKDGYESLIKSIQDFGFHDVLKVDTDGTIISGHQRKKALKEIGIEEVNVMYPDRKLTEKEMDIIALKSNRHEGDFDFDILGNMFEMDTLIEAGFEGFELGFATSKESEGEDENPLEGSMETYLAGNMKQITMIFSLDDYEKVIPRLNQVMVDTNTKTHKEAFLALLDEHEHT